MQENIEDFIQKVNDEFAEEVEAQNVLVEHYPLADAFKYLESFLQSIVDGYEKGQTETTVKFNTESVEFVMGFLSNLVPAIGFELDQFYSFEEKYQAG